MDKVTKDIVIRCALFGACRLPKLGSRIEENSQSDLTWAERIFTDREKSKMTVPLWTRSGSGYGDGDGSGYGYGDGDGSGSGSGYSDGSGDGDGYGYSDGDGDGYGDGSGYGSKLFEKAISITGDKL